MDYQGAISLLDEGLFYQDYDLSVEALKALRLLASEYEAAVRNVSTLQNGSAQLVKKNEILDRENRLLRYQINHHEWLIDFDRGMG